MKKPCPNCGEPKDPRGFAAHLRACRRMNVGHAHGPTVSTRGSRPARFEGMVTSMAGTPEEVTKAHMMAALNRLVQVQAYKEAGGLLDAMDVLWGTGDRAEAEVGPVATEV